MTTTVAAVTPWVERYRPKSLKDVSHQNEVVATLQNAVETGRLPHLLFYGPPGSGKVRVWFQQDAPSLRPNSIVQEINLSPATLLLCEK